MTFRPFSYASLLELKKSRMYCRGDKAIESPSKPCHTLCNLSFLLQLTIFNACFNKDFNAIISLTHFLKNVTGGWIVSWVCLWFFRFWSTDLLTASNKHRIIICPEVEKLQLWHIAHITHQEVKCHKCPCYWYTFDTPNTPWYTW